MTASLFLRSTILSALSLLLLAGDAFLPCSAGAAPPPGYHFTIGETTIYALEYLSSSVTDFGALFRKQDASIPDEATPGSGPAMSFETKVSGELSASVLEKSGEGAFIVYRIRGPVVSIKTGGQEAVSESNRVMTALARPLFALVGPDDRVISVRIDPKGGVFPQSIERSLIAATQFIVPVKNAGRLEWETEEDDTNGRYLARYEVVQPCSVHEEMPAAAVIRKTKIKYLDEQSQSSPGTAEPSAKIIPSGAVLGVFDCTAGRLLSLKGEESQVINIADKQVASTKIRFQIDFVRRERANREYLAFLHHELVALEKVAKAVSLSWREPEEVSETALQKGKLGSATLEDLLSELRSNESEGMKPPGNTQLFLKFKALLYLHPEASDRVAEVMIKAPAKSLTMNMLTEALAAVGHANAQKALVSVIRKRGDDIAALELLLPSLTKSASPTMLAEETLHYYAFTSSNSQLSGTARLLLGTMARTLSRSSPERAKKIIASLVGQLAKKPGTEQARQLLLALGNTGSVAALPDIRGFFADPSSRLRAAATLALRFIEGVEADDLLMRALTEDHESTVRFEAADALGYRQMTTETYRAQKKAFDSETDDFVRLVLVGNLWKARAQFPEASLIVKSAATSDRSMEVRKKAMLLVDADG